MKTEPQSFQIEPQSFQIEPFQEIELSEDQKLWVESMQKIVLEDPKQVFLKLRKPGQDISAEELVQFTEELRKELERVVTNECSISKDSFGIEKDKIKPEGTALIFEAQPDEKIKLFAFASVELSGWFGESKTNPVTRKPVTHILSNEKQITLADVSKIIAETPEGQLPNLSWLDLSGVEFPENFDFKGANLRGAKLQGVNFRGANLGGADLVVVHLQEADLRGANLREAQLIMVDLRGVNLVGADFRRANLYMANLAMVNLEGFNLSGISLEGAYLRGVKLAGANLQGANLKEAHLGGADLRFVNLTNATIDSRTILDGALVNQETVASYIKNRPANKHDELTNNPLLKLLFPTPGSWQEKRPSTSISNPLASRVGPAVQLDQNQYVLARKVTNRQKAYSFVKIEEARNAQNGYDKYYVHNAR